MRVGVWLTHVVLVAVALGAVVVWGTGADPKRADNKVTLPDPDPRLPVVAALSIVRPPGTLVLDTTRHQQGAALDSVMSPAEAEALGDAGAVDVKAQIARGDDFSRGVWQIALKDTADHAEALRVADDQYGSRGWTLEDYPVAGVLVRKLTPAPGQPLAAYRAHYRYGPYLIRIEAYGPEPDRVAREFTELAGRQLAESPPDAP